MTCFLTPRFFASKMPISRPKRKAPKEATKAAVAAWGPDESTLQRCFFFQNEHQGLSIIYHPSSIRHQSGIRHQASGIRHQASGIRHHHHHHHHHHIISISISIIIIIIIIIPVFIDMWFPLLLHFHLLPSESSVLTNTLRPFKWKSSTTHASL